MTHGLDINSKQPQTVRIPLMDETDLRPGQEGSFTKDKYFLNGYFEPIKNILTQEIEYHFIKRPGYVTIQNFTAGTGHRIYYWKTTATTYGVVGNLIEPGLGVTLNITTPTSFVGMAETRPGATTQYLGVNTGSALYLIANNNTVIVMNNVPILSSSVANPTTITTTAPHNLLTGNKIIIRNHVGSTPSINDTIFVITKTGANTFTIPVNVTVAGAGGTIGQFPVNTTGDLVYMDGYWFVIDTNNIIWNCKVDDPTTWAVTDFINSQMQPGRGVGLARQNNFLVAFSDRHFQLFIDNANPVGSPLQNVEQGMQQIGCADNASIAFQENTVYWVANTLVGGFSIHRLDGTTNLQDIATPTIKRTLQQFNGTMRGFILRHSGHTFYILNITTGVGLNVTYVYNHNLNIWMQWTDTSGTANWPIVDITQQTFSNVVGLHKSDGTVNQISQSVFQDNSISFPVVMQANPLTFGTMARKFYNRVELVGDRQGSTANALVSFTDDDYVTFSPTRTFDMSQIRVFSRNWGNSRRRAWKISYTGNTPLRVFGLEFTIELDVS